jgi:phosphoribosylformimino-5-aminoimidazole carboxamide ribotide isomerase
LQIVPVLDLKSGEVVHARRGERSRYRPVTSNLCAGSAAYDIVNALLGLFRFKVLYLADLDAIEGTGHHAKLIEELHARYPKIELWVDSGISERAQLEVFARRNFARPVIGSETLRDASLLAPPYPDGTAPLLSLDFMGGSLRGPRCLLKRPALWPDEIIVMTLDRVGSAAGPDFARLSEIRNRAPGKNIFAAGGVRGVEDILRLERSGMSGALVASALHDGSLTAAHLEALQA